MHTKEDIKKIGELLKGSKRFAIQNFKPAKEVIDPKYKEIKPFSKEELEEFANRLDQRREVQDLIGEAELARQSVPALLATIEALTEERDRLRQWQQIVIEDALARGEEPNDG